MFIAFYVFIRHYICFLNKVYSFCKAEIINSIYAFGNLGHPRGSPWFEPGFPLWGTGGVCCAEPRGLWTSQYDLKFNYS